MTNISRILIVLAVGLPTQSFGQRPNATVEAEVLTFADKVVHPSQITRPSGPFVLILRNDSSRKHLAPEIHLRSTSGAGTTVLKVDFDQTNGTFTTRLNLAPGTYDL